MVEASKRSGLSEQEAAAQASASSPKYDDLALHCPPEQVDWALLHRLSEIDTDLALDRWEEVKQAAGEELASGTRAMQAAVGYNLSWGQGAVSRAWGGGLRAAGGRGTVGGPLVGGGWGRGRGLWGSGRGAWGGGGGGGGVGGDPTTRKPDEPRVSYVEMLDRA